MYSIETTKQENLGHILEKLVKLKSDSGNTEAKLHDPTVYNATTNRESKSQTLVQKFISHSMDERLDVYVLLEIIITLHSFESKRQTDLNLTTEKLLPFARRLLSNTLAFKFLIGVIYELHYMTSFKPSDLGGCFLGDSWTQNEFIEIPCRIGNRFHEPDEDVDEEICNDFVTFEQLTTKWSRYWTSVQGKKENHHPTIEGNKLIIQNLTWNVEGFEPTMIEHVKDLFSPVVEYRPHIIVIGLEELFEMKFHNISKIVSNSSMPDEAKHWQNYLTLALRSMDDSYELIAAEVNGGVMMIVFSNLPKHEYKVKKPVKTNLGSIGGMFANKAAVTLNMTVRKARLQFIVCHLESGESEKSNGDRVSQLQSIAQHAMDNNRIDDPGKKVVLGHHRQRCRVREVGYSPVYSIFPMTSRLRRMTTNRSF